MKNNKIKTNWNLKLLYKSDKDPQIQKDISNTESLYKSFAKKYKKNEFYLKNEKTLFSALEDYEKLIDKSKLSKVLYYFYYLKDLNAENQYAESMINKLSTLSTKIENEVLFFNIKLGKINNETKEKFLKSKILKKYYYHLHTLFQNAKYDLTEMEEKILGLKELPGYEMWINGVQKSLNKKTVLFKGKQISLGEAQNRVSGLPTKDRRILQDKILEKLRETSDFAESEINAIYNDKKINDELRGFRYPYSGRILSNGDDEKEIIDLVNLITKNFHISQRFYRLKAKILGLKKLEYADRSVSIGKINRKFDFNSLLDSMLENKEKFPSIYLNTILKHIKNGQADVFPSKSKTGGAYCSSGVNLPTMVLLNYTNDLRSTGILAHEFGHSLHAELSKTQSPIYQGHSLSVAETSSTFFENIMFDFVFSFLNEKEKIIALHDKINNSIATIFRQIACFNFELELHNKVRKDGSISKEEILKIMNKNMSAYLGNIFDLREIDGYFFVFWSHIRNFFYVYTYAYGELISNALYENYKKDKNYFIKIEKFLSAGRSNSPKNIFKDIGINLNNNFFENGLKKIKKDIDLLEKLVDKNKFGNF